MIIGSPVYSEQIVTAPDGTAGNNFGGSVALAQDTAVVGASAFNANAQGSAYVYVRSGPTWILQQKLAPSDGRANDEFGISVAISGETALVGAWGASVDYKIFQGAADQSDRFKWGGIRTIWNRIACGHNRARRCAQFMVGIYPGVWVFLHDGNAVLHILAGSNSTT